MNEENSTSKKTEQEMHPADPKELPFFLTADETASLLRTTRAAIYTMSDRGRLPGVTRVGRRLLVNRDELLRSLSGNRVPSPGRSRR